MPPRSDYSFNHEIVNFRRKHMNRHMRPLSKVESGRSMLIYTHSPSDPHHPLGDVY